MTVLVQDMKGELNIPLAGVDQFTTASDAAHHLWQSIHAAATIHGGSALLRTPDDGEWGFLVRWNHGPNAWASTYVMHEFSDAPGFTASTDDGMEVRFVDLD